MHRNLNKGHQKITIYSPQSSIRIEPQACHPQSQSNSHSQSKQHPNSSFQSIFTSLTTEQQPSFPLEKTRTFSHSHKKLTLTTAGSSSNLEARVPEKKGKVVFQPSKFYKGGIAARGTLGTGVTLRKVTNDEGFNGQPMKISNTYINIEPRTHTNSSFNSNPFTSQSQLRSSITIPSPIKTTQPTFQISSQFLPSLSSGHIHISTQQHAQTFGHNQQKQKEKQRQINIRSPKQREREKQMLRENYVSFVNAKIQLSEFITRKFEELSREIQGQASIIGQLNRKIQVLQKDIIDKNQVIQNLSAQRHQEVSKAQLYSFIQSPNLQQLQQKLHRIQVQLQNQQLTNQHNTALQNNINDKIDNLTKQLVERLINGKGQGHNNFNMHTNMNKQKYMQILSDWDNRVTKVESWLQRNLELCKGITQIKDNLTLISYKVQKIQSYSQKKLNEIKKTQQSPIVKNKSISNWQQFQDFIPDQLSSKHRARSKVTDGNNTNTSTGIDNDSNQKSIMENSSIFASDDFFFHPEANGSLLIRLKNSVFSDLQKKFNQNQASNTGFSLNIQPNFKGNFINDINMSKTRVENARTSCANSDKDVQGFYGYSSVKDNNLVRKNNDCEENIGGLTVSRQRQLRYAIPKQKQNNLIQKFPKKQGNLQSLQSPPTLRQKTQTLVVQPLPQGSPQKTSRFTTLITLMQQLKQQHSSELPLPYSLDPHGRIINQNDGRLIKNLEKDRWFKISEEEGKILEGRGYLRNCGGHTADRDADMHL